MKTVSEAVGERIKKLLVEKNMNLNKLALGSGMFYGTLDGIMRGRTQTVQLTSIVKIASGFEMSASEFLDDDLFDEDNLKID